MEWGDHGKITGIIGLSYGNHYIYMVIDVIVIICYNMGIVFSL